MRERKILYFVFSITCKVWVVVEWEQNKYNNKILNRIVATSTDIQKKEMIYFKAGFSSSYRK